MAAAVLSAAAVAKTSSGAVADDDINRPGYILPPDSCFVSKEYSQVKGGMASIISTFQKACAAPAFAKYWENYAGLEAPYFHINPHLQVGTPGYDKFHSVIAASTSKTSKDTTV